LGQGASGTVYGAVSKHTGEVLEKEKEMVVDLVVCVRERGGGRFVLEREMENGFDYISFF